MAITTGAAILGGSIIGAGASIAGSRSAARASQNATNTAVGESRRQFETTRQDLLPYIQTGQGALSMLARLYGIPQGGGTTIEGDFRHVPGDIGPRGTRLLGRIPGRGPGAPTTPTGPDSSVFFESPDYQFNLEQGQQAIDRSLAARGKALSGQGVKEGARFASGLASREFGSFFDRLATLAGIGNTGAAQSAAAGSTSASQIGGAALTNGATQANARMSAAAGVNSAAQGGISNFLLMRMLQNKGAG